MCAIRIVRVLPAPTLDTVREDVHHFIMVFVVFPEHILNQNLRLFETANINKDLSSR